MKKLTILISAAAVLLIGIVCVSMYFSYNNKEIALRKQAEAQESKIEGVYDKMWKTISQKAQVTIEYKTAFRDIYKDIIEGRYSQGDGSFMKWITEANPDFDASIYKDLMSSIEVLRAEFQHSQERMVDIQREHNTLISTVPGRWFITNKTPIEYEVISSTTSKEVMETRKEDEVDLFQLN